MNVFVQSFLNSATKRTVAINDATTVAQLKTLINGIEGVDTGIMLFYFNKTLMVNANTVVSYGVTEGSTIGSANTIESLPTREQRQIAKLNLAQLRRQDPTTYGYRTLNVYDRDLLPTKYVDNASVDNPNPGGLQEGRPWKEGDEENFLLLEDGDKILLEDDGFIPLENS